MEKALIRTKERKTNIFQRIRIKRFKKSMNKDHFDFQKYEDAPIYIKRDNSIIDELISKIRYDELDINATEKEKFYLEIPQDIIIERLDNDSTFLKEFSIEKQMEFAKLKPSIVKFKEEQTNILKKASELKQYNFWKMYPEFQEETLEDMKKEGSLDTELPNIIKYLKNKEKFIVGQPDLLSNLDIEDQFKYVYIPGLTFLTLLTFLTNYCIFFIIRITPYFFFQLVINTFICLRISLNHFILKFCIGFS